MQINTSFLTEQEKTTAENTEKTNLIKKKNDILKPAEFFNDKVSFGEKSEAGFSFNYGMDENGNKTSFEKEQNIDLKECMDSIRKNITPDMLDKMEELGIIADKEDPANILTVSERIKIELATHCENFKGDTSNISKDDIEKISGNNNTAKYIEKKLREYNLPSSEENINEIEEAYNKYNEIQKVDESAKKYLLENKKTPTIENLYKSKYSTSEPKNTQTKISTEEWDNLQPQIEKILSKNNLDVNEENINTAKKLLNFSIAVNPENISKLKDLENINTNKPEIEIIDNIVKSVAYGEKPQEALVIDLQNYKERALEAVSIISNATDQKLQTLISEEKEINILGIKNAKEETNVEYSSLKLIEEKEKIYELTLLMTAEAGLKMLKKGINIETETLENLIKEIREIKNKKYYEASVSVGIELSEENIETVEKTISSLEKTKNMSSEIFGKLMKKEILFNLKDVSEVTENSTDKNQRALNYYEQMGTQVRKDLGDSFSKAFNSIDSILENLNMEATEKNIKAVKILAYNEIEITKDNINEIKYMDSEVERLTKNLSPKMVMHLIKEGINPLNTEINKLNEALEKINSEVGKTKEEKYSEFLWKMDNCKTASFNKEEREAFIGLYRTFNLMEKDDYQALGYLMNTKSEVTINSMVNAIKSKRAKGTDVNIDDTFENLKEVYHGKNLFKQLEGFATDKESFEYKYNKNIIKNTIENMYPENLSRSFEKQISEMSLEKFSENIIADEMGKEYHKEYEYQRFMNNIQETEKTVEIIKKLMNAGQSTSIISQIAMSSLVKGTKGIFEKIEEENEEEVKEIYTGNEKDEEELTEKIEKFSDKIKKINDEKIDNEDIDKLDLNKIKLINAGLELTRNLAKNKNYHFPVEINGEMIAFNLTMIEETEKKGKIKIDFESNEKGKIKAELQIKENKITGNIYNSKEDEKEFMSEIKEDFIKAINESAFESGNINLITYENIEKADFTKPASVEEKEREVKTKDLFDIAKLFISVVKRKM